MRFLSKIFLLISIIFVFIFDSISLFECKNDFDFGLKNANVYSVENVQQNNNLKDDFSIVNSFKNEKIIANSRQTDFGFDGNSFKCFFVKNKFIDNLLIYLYNFPYLKNSTKIACSYTLFEINPNAP